MSRALKIADTLSLPIDAATQTFAFIARKGAGKTYTAGKLVELLLDAGVQVVVLDTVGNWYGLRLAADGKSAGFDVPVLGGLRGDLTLLPDAGALIADLVVDTGRSLVIDISQFSLADRKRFATAFGERLWLKKKADHDPAPLHLVIEESQLIVPQDVRGDTAKMVGVFEEIIRLGRNYGIGVSMITQRPQSVNKEVLNQTECLFVGQVNGAQERDALKKWITHQGMDVKLVDELPALKVGTFYVWSPQWLNILERVHILPKRTLDASATPKVGDRQTRRELKPLDLTELQQRMASTIEKAKADDPRELRKQLAEAKAAAAQLQRELERVKAAPAAGKPTPILTDADRELITALRDEFLIFSDNIGAKADAMLASLAERAKATIDDALTRWTTDVDRRRELFAKRLEGARVQRIIDKLGQVQSAPAPRHTLTTTKGSSAGFTGAAREPRRPPADGPADSSLSSGGQIDQDLGTGAAARILAVIKQYPGAPANQIGALAGVSPRLSTWRVAIARLRQAGLIEGDRAGFRLTPLGEAAAASVPDAPTGAQAIDHWRQELGDGAPRLIFDALVEAHPRALSAMEVHERTGVDPSKSTYRVAIAALRHRQLVEGNRDGMRAASALFT